MKRCYPLLPLSEPLSDRRTEAERAVDRVCGPRGAVGSPLTRLAALRLSLDSLSLDCLGLGDGVVVGPADPLYGPLEAAGRAGGTEHRPGGQSSQGAPVARDGNGAECTAGPAAGSGWYLDADGERRWGRDWRLADPEPDPPTPSRLWNGAAWALVFEAGVVALTMLGVWLWRLTR
jgi:hypothetical protein